MEHAEYLADAAFMQESDVRRAALVEMIRSARDKRYSGSGEAVYFSASKYMQGLRLTYPPEKDSPAARLNHDLVEMKRGGRAKGIPPYLAWLNHRHPDFAEILYKQTGLNKQIGLDYRPYGGPSDPSQKTGPGPILPAVLLPAGTPAINKDGRPAEGAIKFPHPDGILGADFSPCGKFIVVAGEAKQQGSGVFIWQIDAITPGDQKTKIAYHDEDVAFVMVSPDCTRVAAAFKETAGIFYAGSKMARVHLFSHKEQITTIAYSPDGNSVATASWDGTACVWDANTGERRAEIKLLTRAQLRSDEVVNSAHFSHDNALVIVACSDNSVTIWNATTGEPVGAIEGHHHKGVGSAMFSPDGHTIATAGSDDLTVGLWDATTAELKNVLGQGGPHRNTVWSAEFSTDGQRLVTAGEDGLSVVWDIETKEIVTRLEHPSHLRTSHFSPDGQRVLTACGDGNAYLWRIA